MIHYAFQITPVAYIQVTAVGADGETHLLHQIILRIAVSETVGHYHIKHIGRSESLSAPFGFTGTQLIVTTDMFLA